VFLNQAGLSCPTGKIFKINQMDDAIAFIREIGWPVVIKPVSSSKGDQVYANIKNEDLIKEIWAKIFSHHKEYLVEKYFVGSDYRFFATVEKVVAVTNRIPANVTGNGEHTISQLIEAKNSQPDQFVKIIIDDVLLKKLSAQDMSSDSVPRSDEKVFLRDNANLSTGGELVDVTDLASEEFKQIAVKAVRSIPGLMYAGVDIIASDIKNSPSSDNYTIIELNASASIAMHQFPPEGKPRDVAGAIVDLMFPETKGE